MTENIKPSLYRRSFYDNPLFITGLTRSGKTMIAPIISSLKNVEKVNVNFQFEYIPMLNIINYISDEVSSTAMRYFIDNQVYESSIGRNMNLRYSDWTSIWKNSEPSKYYSRLFRVENEQYFEEFKSSNQIFPLLVHDALWHLDKYLNAFPKLKMIHIDRHPVDLIYSWYNKGYGSDYYADPKNDLLTISWENNILPYYAYGWEEEYVNLPEMSRIIKMVHILQENGLDAYNSLSEKNKSKIFFIRFENFAESPKKYINKISTFLNTEMTIFTSLVMEKERVPRVLNLEERKLKKKEIKKNSDEKTYELLLEMIKRY
tara:strand:- start:1977 stop:2927 length:951 start_codon:yes stop_codon:yes gene_type:complete